MTEQFKREFDATLATGMKDKEFLNLMKLHCEGFRVPGFFSSGLEKKVFCIFYQGYLLGKHKDDPKNYLTEKP